MKREALSEVRLVDLRGCPASPWLDQFIALYERTFTDPREREDPAQWRARLAAELPPPQPRTHLLAAVADGPAAEGRVVGGLVFEYYRRSRCGLLTYVVVEPAWRGRDLARRLVAEALRTLGRDARTEGAALRAVFAEMEHPALVPAGEEGPMPAWERARAMAGLGARWIDLPYVQPQLEGGSDRCRHLLLLALAQAAEREGRIRGEVVRDFLHEFYQALGVADPQADPDFQAMERYLQTWMPLKDPRTLGEERHA